MTTIEKIHREVDTAEDRILAKATAIIEMNKPSSTKDKIISKAERLKKVGFAAAIPIIEAERLMIQDSVTIHTKEEAERIQYYKREYPFNKFLTEGELDRICAKYGLTYASVDKYTGDIPEKNLRDIENAKPLKKEDKVNLNVKLNLKCYTAFKNSDLDLYFRNNMFDKSEVVEGSRIKGDWDLCRLYNQKTGSNHKVGDFYSNSESSYTEINKEGLFIAAPKSMFNLQGLKKHGLGYFTQKVIKPAPKDPVVFKYVKGGILVDTKWGIEAEDKLLQNEIEN